MLLTARGQFPASGTLLDGIRVLVVDDDPANAKLVAIVLADESCETRTVATAEQALTTLIDWVPDVIVLDLMLPAMSGLSLAQHLRLQSATAAVPIIAVSALSGPTMERAALAAGCSIYIRKPIDISSFAQLLLAHAKGLR